jgi:hypothetical protein
VNTSGPFEDGSDLVKEADGQHSPKTRQNSANLELLKCLQ